LPTGWNSNQTFYTLKYRSRKADKLQLLFKGIVAGDVFIASALVRAKVSLVQYLILYAFYIF
jgi:proteasome inhibitor subunit 1 (PI31)